MTQRQAVIDDFMALWPPHPSGHGVLDGFRPGSTEKKQYTSHKKAGQAAYLRHLQADQAEPRGIGQYSKHGDLAHWLCLDIDDKTEAGYHVALILCEIMEEVGLVPYLEPSTRGGVHIWAFTPQGGLSCETVVKAGKALVDRLEQGDTGVKVEIYPASSETDNVFGGKYVNLPYRGALLDPGGYGATSLTWEGALIPVDELGKLRRSDAAAWEALASRAPVAEAPTFTATGESAPEVWEAVKAAAELWTPSARHEAFLALAGAAKHTGTGSSEAQGFIEKQAQRWFSADERRQRDVAGEIARAVKDTYAKTGKTTGIATLRRLGCKVPKQRPKDSAIIVVNSSTPGLTLKHLKERIAALPRESEAGLEQAHTNGLFAKIGQLDKVEQGILLQALKRQTGIGLTEARAYVRDAASEEQPTPSQLRDMVLEAWQTTGFVAKYIAEWQEWHVYESGVYKKTLPETVEKRVNEILEANGQQVMEYLLKDVIAKLARSDGVYVERAPAPNALLNVQNGLFNLETFDLEPHSSDVLSFAQAPTAYDPAASCPKFDAFLKRVLPDKDHRAVLQEFAGYCLTSRTFLQRALYLKGPGGTGKGTLVSVLKALLSSEDGHGLAADMNIEDLNDGSPSIVNALSKRLIYISEVPAKANLLGFKKVVGEDRVVINPKYKRPFDVKLEAKIIITANTWIHTGDDNANNSIDRRLIILPFEVTPRPEDYNPNIARDLSTPDELAGVLNWALRGWQRLQEQGYRFSSHGDSSRRLEFLENSNPVITFLRERCRADPDGKVQSQDLFNLWKEWCEGYEVNIAAGTYDGFGKERERWRRVGGSGHYVGSIKSFVEKTADALRVLEWDVERKRENSGVFWLKLAILPKNGAKP